MFLKILVDKYSVYFLQVPILIIKNNTLCEIIFHKADIQLLI